MSPILQLILTLIEEAATNPAVKAWMVAQLKGLAADPATPGWEKFVIAAVLAALGA